MPVAVGNCPLLVAEVPYGRHAYGELRRERRLDGVVELVWAQARQPVQRVRSTVPAQMAVGVDQAGSMVLPGM